MMGVGIRGVGVARARGFNPATLFQGGTVAGAWYDPSDLSTMFDTSAGTTPVAMPGQGAAVPVGLMLDKSQGGVGTNGAKRVNLLTYSEQFDNAAWLKSDGAAVSANAAIAPDGTLTADQLDFGPLNTSRIQQVVSGPSASKVYSIWARVASGTENIRFGEATLESQFTLTTTWQRLPYTLTQSGANFTILNSAAGGAKTIYIWGADLRLASEANTAPTYQRIDANWYSTMAGNHAIAFNNTTARPELRAQVNLLTYSEEFDNGAWLKFAVAITANAGVAPNGTTTADLLYPSSATANASLYRGGFASISKTHSYAAKAAGKNFFCILKEGTVGGAAWFNLATGQIGTVDAAYTASMVSLGNGWYRCSVTSLSGFNQYTAVSAVDADNSVTPTVNGTDGVLIWGADLRPANIGANVPAYQRIADANTYDTSGFPLYLRFDGIDDSMYTPANLDLSGTDKVTVFAGVRKLSDAAACILAETSANSVLNNGSFYFAAPDSANPRYGFALRGNTASNASLVTFAAPISNVVTALFDIDKATISDEIKGRVNGANVALSSTSGTAGTGNFGTYPLYIGARNNSSLWFNGHLHSLIIAGSAVSAGNISATEQWVAGKTGIQI